MIFFGGAARLTRYLATRQPRCTIRALSTPSSGKPYPIRVSQFDRFFKRGVNTSTTRATGGQQRPAVDSSGEFIPITWKSLVITCGIAAGGLYYLQQEKKAMDERLKKREAETQDTSYGKPAIGGPFKLTDCETGKEVTDQEFLGKFTIIYFGFTHCPDVCPDELEKMSKAISKLDLMPKVGEMLTPVFISVDPKRDSPEAVKTYIKEFHPRFRGLTGTDEQVRQATKAYRVYYAIGESDGDDYLVDHSIFFFLMDPEGTFLDFYGRQSTAEDIVDKVSKHIREWNQDKKAGRL